MGSVRGTATLDGVPMKFGTVMFQCQSGGQPARGEIQPDGSFVLSTFRPEDGALVGKHQIRVVCYSAQDPAKRGAGPIGDSLGTLLIPERYTSLGASGLSFEVKPGENEPVKLELVTKAPRR
jgi:hypothetical protein